MDQKFVVHVIQFLPHFMLLLTVNTSKFLKALGSCVKATKFCNKLIYVQ